MFGLNVYLRKYHSTFSSKEWMAVCVLCVYFVCMCVYVGLCVCMSVYVCNPCEPMSTGNLKVYFRLLNNRARYISDILMIFQN